MNEINIFDFCHKYCPFFYLLIISEIHNIVITKMYKPQDLEHSNNLRNKEILFLGIFFLFLQNESRKELCNTV